MWLWLAPTTGLAQIAPPLLDNPDLWGGVEPTEVPNADPIEVFGWDLAGADVAAAGVPIDCLDLLVRSANGGHFVRATAAGDVGEGVGTVVTGLIPGVGYRVRFEAAIVRHYGQSWGRWRVTLGAETREGDWLVLPTSEAQSPWRTESLDFVAALETEGLVFEAESFQDGATSSPTLDGTGSCPYFAVPVATDLLLDGVELIADTDADGVFDDTDRCPEHPDAAPGDSDGDGLADVVEPALGGDPCATDTDGDGLDDGAELALGCDLGLEDSDDDNATDGEEVRRDTDCRDPFDLPQPKGGGGPCGSEGCASTAGFGGALGAAALAPWFGRRRRGGSVSPWGTAERPQGHCGKIWIIRWLITG